MAKYETKAVLSFTREELAVLECMFSLIPEHLNTEGVNMHRRINDAWHDLKKTA